MERRRVASTGSWEFATKFEFPHFFKPIVFVEIFVYACLIDPTFSKVPVVLRSSMHKAFERGIITDHTNS